jgi:hypothetical protein
MEVNSQLYTPAALPQPPGKSPCYQLDRRLGGPQSRSGRGGEDKNSQPLPGLEAPTIQPIVQRYTTELRWLFKKIYEGVSKSYQTESITKCKLTTINTSREATQRVIAAKLITLTHKIAIQLHLVRRAVPLAVFAPGGQFGNFWIHPHTHYVY